MEDLEIYRYSKQFLFTGDALSFLHARPYLSSWQKKTFGDRFFLFRHPALAVSYSRSAQNEVLCLGEVLDADRPEATNDDIAKRLVSGLKNFDQFEKCLAGLAGRWVIVARRGDATYLYHDAGGLKTVFLYRGAAAASACVGSQPGLLAHVFSLPRLPERDVEMRRIGASQWPPYVYPYDGITQLLPNHRLNLSNYSIERYWPKVPPTPVDLDEAADAIIGDIRHVIEASVHRRPCHLALTGGHDSRLLLGASLELKNRVSYFTTRYTTIPRHDVVTPRHFARVFKLRYAIIDDVVADPALLDILADNTSGMYLHPNYKDATTLAGIVRNGYFLHGLMGEQMRSLYYKDGAHPDVTVEELGQRTEFGSHPLAREGFESWLNKAASLPMNLLDVFYWEHRTGIWASGLCTFREAMIETVPPMNCRRLLETGLAVDVEYRKRPHALFMRMYGRLDKRLLGMELNGTKGERFAQDLKRVLPLPWRVKRALRLI